ncbi:MAG: MazG nucleotide pyrophosphohydrolase domain-containing protein [Pseudonocardiaceae bacterium]
MASFMHAPTCEWKAVGDAMTRNALSPDLTVRDLNDWAKMQLGRLRLALGSDKSSQPAFVLAQAAKLAEEVGELQAEVLGRAGYQRATKDQCFTAESMSGELADVMICVATLASSYDIDLGKALASKIKKVDAHYESQLRTQ